MEEVIEEFKQTFRKYNFTEKNNKLSYAISCLGNCEKINKKEALKIIWMIVVEEL